MVPARIKNNDGKRSIRLGLVLDPAQSVFETALVLLLGFEHRAAEAAPPRHTDGEEAQSADHDVPDGSMVADTEAGGTECQKAKQESQNDRNKRLAERAERRVGFHAGIRRLEAGLPVLLI